MRDKSNYFGYRQISLTHRHRAFVGFVVWRRWARDLPPPKSTLFNCKPFSVSSIVSRIYPCKSQLPQMYTFLRSTIDQ